MEKENNLTFDSDADSLLQRVYNSFPSMKKDPEPSRWAVQICGILYERDSISLVSDADYDEAARDLGDSAATAMDWRDYPTEVITEADTILKAYRWRKNVIVCWGCWGWDGACSCGNEGILDERTSRENS